MLNYATNDYNMTLKGVMEILILNFPQTCHVETVCLLSNRKPDSYVHLNLKMEDYYRIKDAQKEQEKK